MKDYKTITIITRDVNGHRDQHSFSNIYQLLAADLEKTIGEDEILAVFWDDSCVYSQLMGEPITLNEIRGFFG